MTVLQVWNTIPAVSRPLGTAYQLGLVGRTYKWAYCTAGHWYEHPYFDSCHAVYM
jgi:hypothetical protein